MTTKKSLRFWPDGLDGKGLPCKYENPSWIQILIHNAGLGGIGAGELETGKSLGLSDQLV